VNKSDTKVIDAHTHMVPHHFPPLPDGVPARGWPEMVPLADGGVRMVIDGAEFRVFESAYWDIAERLAFMDMEGITWQVLSPLPELMGYWLEPATTAALAAHINATVAQTVSRAPHRLAGMGMLPMQDVELSMTALSGAVELGLRGVLVGSNVNGVSIADAQFYPVLAELERHDMVLFVHGYRPAGADRLVGSPLLVPIIGVPQDTTAAVASFIATHILGRFPRLKLLFAHGGGSFGAVLDRFDHVWAMFPQLQASIPERPRDYARRFFYDSVTFSPGYLRYLIDTFGAAAIIAGTDGPTPIGQRGLAKFVTGLCGDDPSISQAVLWRNAARLFSLQDDG